MICCTSSVGRREKGPKGGQEEGESEEEESGGSEEGEVILLDLWDVDSSLSASYYAILLHSITVQVEWGEL